MKRRLIAALALGVFVLTVAAPLVIASNAVAQSTKRKLVQAAPSQLQIIAGHE